MDLKSVTLALLSGIVVFLTVGAAVTEFTQRWIEFSLFVGIPAGLATGAVTVAAVYFGLTDDAPVDRRRIAGAFAGFGVGFILVLVVFGWIVDTGVAAAIVVSLVVALTVGALAYLRAPKESAAAGDSEGDTPGRIS